MTTLRFAPGVIHRTSKRGLVIADPNGDTVLFEHPNAGDLPALLDHRPTPAELTARLGPPLQPSLIDDLLAAGILTDAEAHHATAPAIRPRLVLDRSGILFPGIEHPSRWIHRHVVPTISSLPGRITLIALVAAGIVTLIAGHPHPAGNPNSPAAQALLILLLGLLTAVLHELGHAVALIHFGCVPCRAGFGFYWGALCFFVDSTPALTLPRRQRAAQALAGLAVDLVSTSVLAILAHTVHNPLLAIVFWQRAILDATAIALNVLPVLEVDGHWALADYLDEPDLSPRARAALAQTIHRRRPTAGYGMAAYGALSLTAGFGLIALSTLVAWHILGNLITALFHGNPADILIGTYLTVPLLLGLAASTLGLILQSLTTAPQPANQPEPSSTPADPAAQPAASATPRPRADRAGWQQRDDLGRFQ